MPISIQWNKLKISNKLLIPKKGLTTLMGIILKEFGIKLNIRTNRSSKLIPISK